MLYRATGLPWSKARELKEEWLSLPKSIRGEMSFGRHLENLISAQQTAKR
jgi:hypothetical protein